MAEISREYDSKIFAQFKNDIFIINTELMENALSLPSLVKFEGIIVEIWGDEQQIVQSYSEQFNIDISQRTNRIKLEKKITEFRLSTALLRYPNIPENVQQIGNKSLEKHYEIQAITTALHNEIDTLMKM